MDRKVKLSNAALLPLMWALVAGSAQAANLTASEIQQVESDLGITLSIGDQTNLAAIVKPDGAMPQWRIDAEARIDAHRKADLDIRVEDQYGNAVEGAQVEVKLLRNDFNFGGILNLKDFTDEDSNLQITTNRYQELFAALYNSAGLDNGLKPKQRAGNEPLIPGFLTWAQTNGIPVRGHNLIWPGTPDNNHLPTELPDTATSYSILSKVEAVEAALTNGSSQAVIDALKVSLKQEIEYMISDWASKWNVYEWDVINEPLSNTRVQEALEDYSQMAEWFKIAASNAVDPACKLMINEFQIISARSAALQATHYPTRSAAYKYYIDLILAEGGRIDRIGFQSRIKFQHPDPQDYYDRLEDFGGTYGLEMVGTEFEVKDTDPPGSLYYPYDYTEQERAQITEEILTAYYSHPLVTGLNAWTYMKDDIASMCYYDGSVKLNGLAWYYLHRIRYNTAATLASGLDGWTGLRAFKGDYEITVGYKGQEYVATLVHTNDESVAFVIGTDVADDPNTANVIDAWSYEGLTNGAGLASGTSTGLVGGVSTPNYAPASIQNETVRWQSDGVAESLYRNIVPSSSVGSSQGLYQLSIDYLDADFSASAAISNGSGRVAVGVRDSNARDVNFRLGFNSGGGTTPEYWLQVSDDLGNNQTIATFPGTTLAHLSVRALYNFDNSGSAGSYKVYYRFEGGNEVEAYTGGQLPAGFALDQLRLTVQTYNGGVNWAAGDRVYTDNLVLRSLGELPPVSFIVDPISKPDATADGLYTGQSISGTATNAPAYSIVSGPSWLNIAANGDLSGTPTGNDAGQNSWIVQASNGIESDTSVLHINVAGTGGGGPGANIGLGNPALTQGWNVSGGSSGTSSFTDISAQQGDVIVLTVAGNKKGTVTPLSCDKVGGTGSVSSQAELTNNLDTYPTSWAWYYTVTTNGTFNFDITTDNTAGITAITALYVVRAGSGSIQLAGSAIWDDNDNANNGTSYSLNYTFGSSLPKGVLIESISSRTDLITEPTSYAEDRNGADKRLLVSYTNVAGTSWTSAYSLSGGVANQQTSGAVGMIFNELTSGAGNNPPVFATDPVVEAGAFQDVAYSASLADNASDGDLDPMSFGMVSGPSWLNVETNGVLTGTPLAGDLGTNSWKVLVSDGTATNFANLQIVVGDPLPPPVSPQNGTNILFIAIDDMKTLLGCYGDPQAITPRIDGLASAGVAFQNAQCQWAVCGPSRASLMTGLYPEETGVMGFKKMRGNAVEPTRANSVVRPNVVTIQQWFRYHGYRTAATGKVNDYRCVGTLDLLTGKVAEDGASKDDPPSWGDPVDPDNLPADFFSASTYLPAAGGWDPAGNPSTGAANLPDSSFGDGIICDNGLSLLNNLAAGDTQFFLGVGFKKPHLPFVAPQQYWNLYDRNDFLIAPFQSHPLHEVSYTWNYAAELANYDDIADPTNIPAAKQLELIHGYYACASFIDAQIGRLLDELEALGLHTNTIVVVWGDHGFHLGDHAEWAKHTNLEQAARVPLVVYSPFTGMAGAKPMSPVNFVDIYPTLCELAGLPVPGQPLAENEDPFAPASGRALKGKSLVPVMQDPSVSLRTGALTLFSRDGAMGYSYRTDRYRYIEWISGGVVVARELYDYELDPLETVNLAGEEGYDALMLQYSQSMRYEMNALALSGSDIACADLQGSPPANSTSGHLALAGLKINGTEVSWPDATGSTYCLLSKTNLLDASWSTNQAGLSGSPVVVPQTERQEFYRVDLSE